MHQTKKFVGCKRRRLEAPVAPPPEPEPPYPKVHGITGPINEDLPEDADLILTKTLMDTLRSYGVHEDELAQQSRERIIKDLEVLLKEWLIEMCVEMNVPDIVREKVGGRIFPFGSFRLGVHSRDSDIDALCVGPGFIERKDFFSSFYQKLAAQKEVTDIHAIEEAYVPVIKLTYKGQEIDLIYAMYPRRSVPDTVDLMDDSFVKSLDPICVRSFNGYRMTEEILRLVPNVFTFRHTLRVIKLWAKQRHIYSNILGFLGGISWTILVARVCQVYPNATAATLVTKFFKIYNMWDWRCPIRLRIVNHSDCKFPFWDPRFHKKDGTHAMPIITPAYPQQNTSYNVTASNLAVIREEFQRGHVIMEAIYNKSAQWAKLFEQEELKDKYQHNVVVEASCLSESQSLQWVGFVESKIRHLVGILDRELWISLVRADPKSFPGPTNLHNGEATSTMWSLGLVLNQEVVIQGRPLNIAASLQSYTEYVYNMARAIGILQEGMVVSASLRSRGKPVQNVKPKKRKLVHQNGTLAKKAKVETPPAAKPTERVRCSEKPSASVASTSTWRPKTPDLDTRTTTTGRDLPQNKESKLTTSTNVSPSEEPSLSVSSTKRPRSPEVETPAKKLKIDLTPDIDSWEPCQLVRPKIRKHGIKLTLLSHK